MTWGDIERSVCDRVADDVPKVIGGGAQQSPTRDGRFSGTPPALVSVRKSGPTSKSGYTPAPKPAGDPLLKGDWDDYLEAMKKGSRTHFATVGPKNVERWRKAADAGDPKAVVMYAKCVEYGYGVPKDEPKAAELFEKVIGRGDGLVLAIALANLADLYDDGRGVPEDAAKAFELFQKAADLGLFTAVNNLGYMYEKGRGVAVDEAKAFAMFRKAAELGSVAANTNVAVMYENGRGVPADVDEAVKWYRRAADKGNDLAKAALKRLGK